MEVELKFVWKKLIRGLDLLCKRGCTVIGANTPLLREEEERKSRWRPTRETILEGEDKREQNGWEVLCKYSLPRKLTRRLVWKIISFLYQQRKGESKTRILVICIRWNYWQTIQRESNYCPSIRIDGTTIGTKYFDRQGSISFEETGDRMAQRVNFLDINSFENYYVPRKNRFFAGRNVRVQLWYDTISVTREEKRKDIPHFRWNFKGRPGINAISRENFRVNLVGFSLLATGTHSQNYLIE